MKALEPLDSRNVVPIFIQLFTCFTQVQGILEQKLRSKLKVSLINRLWPVFVIKNDVPWEGGEAHPSQNYEQNFANDIGADYDMGAEAKRALVIPLDLASFWISYIIIEFYTVVVNFFDHIFRNRDLS